MIELAALVLGWLAAGWLGWGLWRWERQLKGARIAVAYKRRVQLQAPLHEWMRWALALKRDERSTGRVVYRNGGVTVAILKPLRGHGKTKTHTIKEKAAA